jgi:hypothetical protein
MLHQYVQRSSVNDLPSTLLPPSDAIDNFRLRVSLSESAVCLNESSLLVTTPKPHFGGLQAVFELLSSVHVFSICPRSTQRLIMVPPPIIGHQQTKP